MKILFSLEYFYPPIGGGELSMRFLAEELAQNHEVTIVYSGETNDTFERFGCMLRSRKLKRVPLMSLINGFYQTRQWEIILDRAMKEIKPDLILTQLNFSSPTINSAKKYNIPSILFIRSYEHFCPIGFINGIECDKKCWNCLGYAPRLQYLVFKRIMTEHKKALQNADLLIANSKYTASVAKEWYDINPEVVYPFIDLKQYKVNDWHPKYILFVGQTEHRGITNLLKIAEKMDDTEFLVPIGGFTSKGVEDNIKKHTNIKPIAWVDDMRQVYAQTRIHIAPRIWPEPFGRVCVEAGVNGIPTIASNVGGLPESVGDGGILINESYTIDKWVEAIHSLNDEGRYNLLSENAKRHAQTFNFEATFKEFKEIVKENLGVEL